MSTPTVTLYPDVLPSKGQANDAFDTNVNDFLNWLTLTNGPELNVFINYLNAGLVESAFLDLTSLLNDTTLNYTNVTVGSVVTARKENFSYEVAAAGATNQHLTTSGGVKLYVVVTGGILVAESFNINVSATEAANGANIQAAINFLDANGGGILEFGGGSYPSTPFILKSGVTVRGIGQSHRVFYVNEPLTRAGTALLITAGVGQDCVTFEGPQRGMHGIEDISIYEIGTAAFGAIISINGALHTHLKNVEAECLTTFGRGVALKYARNATTNTGSIYGVCDNFITSKCGTGLLLVDDANALSFLGGSIAGTLYSFRTQKIVAFPTGVSFSGTSFEGTFDGSVQDIIYVPGNAADVYGFTDQTGGVYVVQFVKIPAGKGISFDGCYFENGGTSGTYNDGVNGTAPILAAISLVPATEGDVSNIRIQGQLACYLYNTAKENVFCDSLPFNKLFSSRLPTGLLLRANATTPIPNNTATLVPFGATAAQNKNDFGRLKYSAGIVTVKERGYYLVKCQVRSAAITTGSFFQLRLTQSFSAGGSDTTYGPNLMSSEYATIDKIVFCEVGDTLQILMFQGSGATVNLNASAAYSRLQVLRIGA